MTSISSRTWAGVRSCGASRPPSGTSASIWTGRVIESFRCDHPVELVDGCAHRFLAGFPFRGRELVYADPPYLHEVRRRAQDATATNTSGPTTWPCSICSRGWACRVMLSGYPSTLYDERLADWRSISLQVNNQACVVTEKIWFNFEPDRVHWASLAGRNRTHRQQVKRKAANWARRYAGMPRSERLAVLAAIMAVEAEE